MVRPVEIQDALAKTPAIEKIVQGQKANPDNEQKMAAAAGEHKHKEHVSQTTEPPRSDEVILHREENKEEEKHKNQKPKNQSNKGEEEDKDKHDDTPPEPPSLDITA